MFFTFIFELFVALTSFDSGIYIIEKHSSLVAETVLSCIAADMWYKQITVSISGRVGVKVFGMYKFAPEI